MGLLYTFIILPRRNRQLQRALSTPLANEALLTARALREPRSPGGRWTSPIKGAFMTDRVYILTQLCATGEQSPRRDHEFSGKTASCKAAGSP